MILATLVALCILMVAFALPQILIGMDIDSSTPSSVLGRWSIAFVLTLWLLYCLAGALSRPTPLRACEQWLIPKKFHDAINPSGRLNYADITPINSEEKGLRAQIHGFKTTK